MMISGVGSLYGGLQRLEMRSTMWILAVVVLLVPETWSTDPVPPVLVNLTFNLGDNATLMCSNKTWMNMLFEIWDISLKHKNCKITFNIDGRSENTCEDDKALRNTTEFQSYLQIPAFSANDQGVYRCESVYSGGIDLVEFTVSASDFPAPGATNTSTNGRVEGRKNFPWIYIPIGVLTFVLLVGFFIFAQKKLIILRRCCQADKSALKTSATEDVEEVEPYASYVQRVNSIYNSSADFFSPKNPAHAPYT
ncbi:uncharacterized protein si:ch211-214p13.9 isoform X2 [Betta splendens]|uniref:Uncharacterized protein si:ch211-214p13.9 isoform X2 n=1 Tax=Betta splendens TaxID=158456 RepID=A0A6P7LFS4_BETSP|nr:uncharacterized protein si:ch211-214p13.9 isoform X2 [Betta splendens]